jgi:hypothetical protein
MRRNKTIPSATQTMKDSKRLSLEELKSKKNVVKNLDSVKGGDTANCHKSNETNNSGGGVSQMPF